MNLTDLAHYEKDLIDLPAQPKTSGAEENMPGS